MVKKFVISLAKIIIYFSENMESLDLCGLVCAISFLGVSFELVIVWKAYCMYQ
jgi:hypothetical protein